LACRTVITGWAGFAGWPEIARCSGSAVAHVTRALDLIRIERAVPAGVGSELDLLAGAGTVVTSGLVDDRNES
jgi:hypothetical protein